MVKYQRKPDIVDAVRYGSETTGEWDDDALARMVAFYLELPEGEEPTEEQIDTTVKKLPGWNPPEEAPMYLGDRDWDRLEIGDYLTRDVLGTVVVVTGAWFPLFWAPADA